MPFDRKIPGAEWTDHFGRTGIEDSQMVFGNMATPPVGGNRPHPAGPGLVRRPEADHLSLGEVQGIAIQDGVIGVGTMGEVVGHGVR